MARKKRKIFRVIGSVDLDRKILTIRPYDPKVKPGEEVILGYVPARVVAVFKKRVSELTEMHAKLAGCKSLGELRRILRYSFWRSRRRFSEDAEVYLIYLQHLSEP